MSNTLDAHSGACSTPPYQVLCDLQLSLAARLETMARNAIVSALDEADFVELSQDSLALGRRREDADS